MASGASSPGGPTYQGERLLDEQGWQEEAVGVIKEIVDYVKLAAVSQALQPSASQIFLNLVTLEGSAFTVLLCERGFSVVGRTLDTADTEAEPVYETPHSLLDNLSPAYRQAWGDHLSLQLLKLQKEQEAQDDQE